MSNYSIRKLEKDEFHLLVPLMRDAFGMDVNINYFEWKFLQNPAGEFVGFIALTDLNEVAAYYGVIPERYMIEDVPTVIFQSCDTMTHSMHRRKGLFQKLATHCYDYLRQENRLFLIGFSGEQSTPGFLKLGWKNIFPVGFYFYPRIFTFFRRCQRNEDIHEIDDVDLISAAAMGSNKSATIHCIKDVRSLRWRMSNPLNSYGILALNGDAGYKSYVIHYVENNKIVIFDFHFNSVNDGVKLVGELKCRLKRENRKGIISFCQIGSRYSEQLSSVGFILNPFRRGPLSEKVPFIFYASQDVMTRFAEPSFWLINAFDHDAF